MWENVQSAGHSHTMKDSYKKKNQICMNCEIYIVKYYSKNAMVLLGLMNKSTILCPFPSGRFLHGSARLNIFVNFISFKTQSCSCETKWDCVQSIIKISHRVDSGITNLWYYPLHKSKVSKCIVLYFFELKILPNAVSPHSSPCDPQMSH